MSLESGAGMSTEELSSEVAFFDGMPIPMPPSLADRETVYIPRRLAGAFPLGRG